MAWISPESFLVLCCHCFATSVSLSLSCKQKSWLFIYGQSLLGLPAVTSPLLPLDVLPLLPPLSLSLSLSPLSTCIDSSETFHHSVGVFIWLLYNRAESVSGGTDHLENTHSFTSRWIHFRQDHLRETEDVMLKDNVSPGPTAALIDLFVCVWSQPGNFEETRALSDRTEETETQASLWVCFSPVAHHGLLLWLRGLAGIQLFSPTCWTGLS